MIWPGSRAPLRSLGPKSGEVQKVTLVSTDAAVPFTQGDDELSVELPDQPFPFPYALKIEGLRGLGEL